MSWIPDDKLRTRPLSHHHSFNLEKKFNWPKNRGTNKESQGQMLALNWPSPSFCLRCHCLSPGQNLSLCLFWKMSSACLNVKKWDILSCLLPSLGFTQGAQPVNCMLEKNALAFEAVTLFFSHLHSCNKDFSLPSLPGLSSNGDFRWSKRSERKPTLKG